MKREKILDISLTFAGILAIILIWIIASLNVNEELILPSIGSTISAGFNLLKEGSFYTNLGNTILRMLASFFISIVVALVATFLTIKFKPGQKLFKTISTIILSLPTISIILLILVWFDTLKAPWVVALVVITPTLTINFMDASNEVDSRLLEMSDLYNVSFIRKVTHLYIPTMRPSLISSLKTSASLNVKLVIAAEVLAQTKDSIGLEMKFSSMYLETPKLFAYTIIAVLISLVSVGIITLIDLLIRRIYRL